MQDLVAGLIEWLGRTGIQAGVLVLLVLLIQWLLGRWLTAGMRYGLWALVVIRLAMPVMPASSWSLFNLSLREEAPASRPLPAAGPVVRVELGEVPGFRPSAVMAAVREMPVQEWNWRGWLALVWAMGVVAFVARVGWANMRLHRRIRLAKAVEEPEALSLLAECCRRMGIHRCPQLLTTDAVAMPALMGILRPRLLMPPSLLEGLSAAEQRFIFLHELAHLKRCDILADWLLALLHAVHWFNPLVWVALGRMRADRELARDAMVLRITRGESAAYGQTILKLVETLGSRPLGMGALGILQEKAHLKRRIVMIASQRQSGFGQIILACLIVPLLAAVAMTGEPKGKPRPAAPAEVRKGPEIQVYDIRDLLVVPELDDKRSDEDRKKAVESLTSEITALIMDTVDRDDWVINGGKVGSIKVLAGQLVITQTTENHAQIASLLDKLREARAVQVSIETQIISCDPEVVAEFLPKPADRKDGKVHGVFLDEFQVNFLMRATQASRNSSVLTAPRVTTFNGQRATISVGNQHEYVARMVEEKAADGSFAFMPILATVQDGVRLELTATASADRKHVTVTIHPTLTELVKMAEIPAPNAAAGQKALIQKPELRILEMKTTASIPNGQTLLLSWQDSAGDKQKHDPKVQFNLAGQKVSTDQLILLVRPTLIIHSEIEQKQFPLLKPEPAR